MENISGLCEALPVANKPVVHVEVLQRRESTLAQLSLKSHIKEYVSNMAYLFNDIVVNKFHDEILDAHVECISITDIDHLLQTYPQGVSIANAEVEIHVYRLHEDSCAVESLEGENDDTCASHQWVLPCTDFRGIWDSLIYDSSVKQDLLHYARTTTLFSMKNVDQNIVSWNRVILLHGPPGTGKTSLCRALAQKLSIQLSSRFSYGHLIEINSHSLFSKWFSESGKLVQKMFSKIHEYVEDKEALVFVLIDEVESLTAARNSALNGTEPSDAIRVVNAVLTQLDHIRKYSNVLILTTSNITGAIDLAFVDRADIKQYIGPPSAGAIYKIYKTCVDELQRVGIIVSSEALLHYEHLKSLLKNNNFNVGLMCLKLMEIAEQSVGLSGRTIRKLPFIAHAVYIQVPSVTMAAFLDGLAAAVQKQFNERDELSVNQGHPRARPKPNCNGANGDC